MSSTKTAQSRPMMTLAVASMMLFSMFFGAGNLIFPPILGTSAGDNFTPAMIGFLVTGVALPVLGVLAIAVSGRDVLDLSSRGGKIFGVIFPVLLYLSIGALYALPRTAAVSFSTGVTPVFGWDSMGAAAIFSAIFFGITLVLALNPNSIVDNLGKYLTPALIALLVVLIVVSMVKLPNMPLEPTEEYAAHPMSAGFINGYLTMDSLAALAFGILLVSSLQYKGFTLGNQLTRAVSIAGIIAGVLLALVYVGLGIIGLRMEDSRSYEDGASLLAAAAHLTLGQPGGILFGLIVVLACLTTAVGLVGASSEFFHKLVPAVSYRTWVIIFVVVAFGLSIMGLQAVLAVAAPIIGLLYPAAITLILLTLIEPLTKKRFHYTFILALTVAVVWSVVMTLVSLGVTGIEPVIAWSPGHAQQLGWALPTLVFALIGFALDIKKQPELV